MEVRGALRFIDKLKLRLNKQNVETMNTKKTCSAGGCSVGVEFFHGTEKASRNASSPLCEIDVSTHSFIEVYVNEEAITVYLHCPSDAF